MKQYFIISAVGPDVPGIVAAISQEIYVCRCNFEDSKMTFLGNNFAIMILVAGEEDTVTEDLKAACERLNKEKQIPVTLFPVDDDNGRSTGPTRPNYEIRIKGIDRLGIVYRTSKLLAAHRVNIVEMETSVESDPETGDPFFTMHCLVAVPAEVNQERLRHGLDLLAEDLNEIISLIRLPGK